MSRSKKRSLERPAAPGTSARADRRLPQGPATPRRAATPYRPRPNKLLLLLSVILLLLWMGFLAWMAWTAELKRSSAFRLGMPEAVHRAASTSAM